MVLLSILMVSTFRYSSFKKFDLLSRRSYTAVLGIALLLLVVALHPAWVLLAVASLYWLSGPTLYVAGMFRRRSGPPPMLAGDEAPQFR